jgi:hypothetical protein
MRNCWVVKGSLDNWHRAFASNGIWGLKDKTYDRVFWLAAAPGDLLFFYVTGKAKRVVGYGTVRNRFFQDVPLWPREVQEGKALWPLRFEFDVDFLLPEGTWESTGVPLPGGGAFRQPLMLKTHEEAAEILRRLNADATPDAVLKLPALVGQAVESITPTHREAQNTLMEIGRLQNYLASIEYPLGLERLDVVWRRLPESVPTYAFEVQVGGDVYHALGKLKHAHDLWNSRMFLVAAEGSMGTATQLLAGTFHEMSPELHLVALDRVVKLHGAKRSIYEIEKEMGIVP